MNMQMVRAARKGLKARTGFVKERGECQKWMREVVESIYGGDYERFRAGSAKDAERLWAGSAFAVRPDDDTAPGDILYKPAGPGMPDGHVGILLDDGTVAENSSSHVSPLGDARGLRTLERFGNVLLIVRLPEN